MKNNTTGVPSTAEYSLGRGIMNLGELDSSDAVDSFWDLGNVTEFTITPEVEESEHYSSRTAERYLDRIDILERALNVSFTCENINQRTLQWFLMGGQTAVANPTYIGFTGAVIVVAGNITLGTIVPLVNVTGSRCYDVVATDITIETSNVTPVALVKDTDYTLNAKEGTIQLISTSTKLATAIAGAEGLTLDLAANTSQIQNLVSVNAFTSTRDVALMFFAEDPKTEEKTEYYFYKCGLRPEGDHGLITEEYKTLTFSGKLVTPDGQTSPVRVTPIVEA